LKAPPPKLPPIASPGYNDFVNQYGLELLKEPGDLQIVDGRLAMTKDLDLMLGDKSYNALFRLAEHWRHNFAHVAALVNLFELMIARRREAAERLDEASSLEAGRRNHVRELFSKDFLDVWHNNFDEEGTAISGQITYSGCVIILASNALSRFKNDLDCPEAFWKQSGRRHGGHSIGEILIASANGFRHADEWAKTRPMTPQQLKSANVLLSALGPIDGSAEVVSPAGRCPEVFHLLAQRGGVEGFTQSIFGFAHDIASACRSKAT
jgi:hypothetical protein